MNAVLRPRSKAEVDAMIAAMKRTSSELLKSKDKARAFLIEHGYITKSGKLTKKYKG